MVEGRFEPGFICYGIPMGTDAYVSKALWEKAEEVKLDLEKVSNILAEDNQALWVALHRSIAHKMDYHLSLCYPTDILPVARHLDSALWSAFELAVGQHVPRQEEGLGLECVVDVPVDNLQGRSFQDHFVRLPIPPRAENAKINVTDEPYFGTQIVCNYLPFSKAAKGAQGGPQQYATFERKHSPTEK